MFAMQLQADVLKHGPSLHIVLTVLKSSIGSCKNEHINWLNS